MDPQFSVPVARGPVDIQQALSDEGFDGWNENASRHMPLVRSYNQTEADRLLALELVREYVDATAVEMGWLPEQIIPYVEEYDNFPGHYLPDGDFLIAQVDGEVAGCMGITPAEEGLCEMNRLWVRPGFRSHGLGQVLVEAGLRRARELGFERMGLDVLPARQKAIELYLRSGFEQCRPFHEYEFEMLGLVFHLSRIESGHYE